MTSSRGFGPDDRSPSGSTALPPAARTSRTLWLRARAARDAAEAEAEERLSAAHVEAAAIRRSSQARVGRLLTAAEEDARLIVETAQVEAGRLLAGARERAADRATGRPDESTERTSVRIAWALVVAIALSTVAVVAGHGGPLAVVAVVALSLGGPGLGLVLALGRAAGPGRGVTTILVSFTWSGAVALASAWTTVQVPVAQYAVLAAPALAGAAVAIGRGRKRAPGSGSAPAPRPRSSFRTATCVGGASLLAISAAAYVVAALGSRGTLVGEYGLLPALGPWFVASVALAVAAVVVAALTRPVPVALASAALATVAFLLMPPPALFDHNLLAGWAYKHLGAVDLIVRQQPLQDPLDVYQQWPGFFAIAAQVEVISGADSVGYANLAQPLFAAMAAFGLASAVHRLYGDVVASVLAALLFVCTMWAGQFYFAPQTLCFALALLCLVHVITLLQSLPQDSLRTGWVGRWFGWTLRDLPPPRPLDTVARRLLVVTVVATYLLVVVSHQITPYVLVLQLAPAAVAGWLTGRWRWGYLVLAAAPVAWLLLHREVLGTTSALTGFSLANAQSLVTGPSGDAQELAATVARVVAVLVLGGGLVCALSYLRRFGEVLLPATLAATPALVLLAGNYGGEAPYRVWLFASPWFCALIAKRVTDLVRGRTAAVVAIGAVAVGTFLGSAQASTYGMYPFLEVSDDEVAASRWLAEETDPGSTIVHLTRTFPGRVSAGYARRNPLHTINDPVLIDRPPFAGGRVLDLPAPELRSAFLAEFGPDAYLVLARSMEAEIRYYGLLPEGSVLDLAATLATSSSWSVAYANSAVWVFAPR